MIARYREGRSAPGPGPGAFDAVALREAIAEQFDRYDITAALDSIWQAVRAQPARGGKRHRGSWPRTSRGRQSSTPSCTTSPTGSSPSPSHSRRTFPRRRRGSWRRFASRSTSRSTGSRPRRPRRVEGIEPAAPLFPRVDAPAAGGVIDTHAHLDALDDPDAAVSRAHSRRVSAASSPSVRRSTAAGRRSTLADRHEGVYAVLGLHPHEAASRRRRRRRSADGAPAAPARGRGRRDRARLLPRLRAARRPARLFRRLLAVAADLGKPVVVHTRAADEDTLAELDGFAGTVVLHCFSSIDLLPAALARGYYVSFAGNVTYPKAEPADGGRAGPGRPPPGRDRQPLPRAAAASAVARTSRRTSSTRSPPLAEARGEDAAASSPSGRSTRSAAAAVRALVTPRREASSSASTSLSTRTSSG